MITAIDAIPSTTSTPNTAGSEILGKNDFLLLLVAQLEAQDPLSPMDSQDFSAQLAQFSSLEQMTNVNANLEKLYAQETTIANLATLNIIGKTVDATGNSITHDQGESHTLGYNLESDASEVQVNIFDSSGNLVSSVGLTNQLTGNNQITWGGLDSLGNPVEEGIYSFNVVAKDAEGDAIGTSTLAGGLVTEIQFDDEGQAFAIVNGEKLSVNKISRIRI